MKNLKKVLALSLVVVMILGIMVTASAKLDAYTDAEQINYTEAVDVLTGIGVLEGMTSTTFEPQGTLTREQAAKIITYLAVGSTAAEAMQAVAAPFDDVAAGRWSAGFIAYCVNEGIINGRGDGTFGPTDEVTGLEFAKMLLCLIGYGENDEYVGERWAVEVARDALQNNIFTGNLAGASNADATREEAALYAFNALFVDNVRYSSLLEEYSTGSILSGAGAYGTIADNVFGLTKYGDDTLENLTSNGLSVYEYRLADGTVVSNQYPVGKVIATSTNGTSISDLTTRNNSAYVTSIDDDLTLDTVEYILNGDDTVTRATAGTAALKVGAVVEFIDEDNNGKADVISIVERTVAVVNGSVTTSTSGAVTTVTVPTNRERISVSADMITGYSDLANGDVIAYVKMADGTVDIEKATVINSTLTSIRGDEYTIGGNVYKVATLTGTSGAPNLNGQVANFYIDSNGYIIYNNTPEAVVTATYGVVTDYAYTQASAINGTTASSRVLMTLADGTTGVYQLVTNNGQVQNDGTVVGFTTGQTYLVKYVMNASGVITSIEKVTGLVDSGSVSVGGGTTTLDGKYVTSATQYFYVNNGKVVTYEGYANAPADTINAGIYKISYAVNSANTSVIDAVMIYSGVAATSQTVAYVTDATPVVTYETINGSAQTVYTYTAYVDGQATEVRTGSVISDGVNIYDIVTDVNTGLSTLTKATTISGEVTVAEATYAVIGGQSYTVNAKTKTFIVTKDATGKITNIAAATLTASSTTETVTATAIVTNGTATNIFYEVTGK